MNERIKLLAEQAGYKPLSPSTFADELNEIFIQKFAQLLITESIQELFQQMYWHGIDLSNYPKFYIAIEKTEKQFGVEQ